MATLEQFGPGEPGVPLDLMETEQPTKWVRDNNGHRYIVLINTEDKPIEVTVKRSEVRELGGQLVLSDILQRSKSSTKEEI